MYRMKELLDVALLMMGSYDSGKEMMDELPLTETMAKVTYCASKLRAMAKGIRFVPFELVTFVKVAFPIETS